MSTILLRVSLPALRALSAIARGASRGASTDCDLRAHGVSRSCVAAATRELRDLDLIVTTPGRCAAPGVRGIASTHVLRLPIADIADIDVSSLSLAQARVRLALAGERKFESTIALARVCGLTAESTRDALRFFSKHTADLYSTPRNSAPPICIAPRKIAPRQFAQHTAEACGSKLETAIKTVSEEKEKQQTAVVVDFAIYQKLIEIGVSNDVASQLIANDENECAVQITRLEQLKNVPKNRAGYLRKAIAMRYRDRDREKTNESTSQAKKSDFAAVEDKNAQEDFDRDYARLTNNSSK